MMPTRRMWMRQVGAVAAAANTCIARLFGAPARTLEVDRLLDRYRNARWEQERTQYRVDAALMMFTSPVHSFGGIGHGFLALGETAGATYVRFGAASSPENAHGFDRAGFIEEASAADEFASFGFITAGHNSESGSIAGGGFTAMDQYLKHRECWFRGAGVPVALADRLHLDKLIGFIRGALPETGGVHRQVELNGAYPSFLHAVLRAVSAKDTRFHCVYVYNAKQFDLSVERHEDSRMAALLEDKGLTRRRDAIRRYEGTIRDQPGQSSGRQWS
ncbi:MAG TPA: hypothetical protein VGL53_14170, partial [Bryobacteraceae bacterium]